MDECGVLKLEDSDRSEGELKRGPSGTFSSPSSVEVDGSAVEVLEPEELLLGKVSRGHICGKDIDVQRKLEGVPWSAASHVYTWLISLTNAKCPPTTGRALNPATFPSVVSYQSENGASFCPFAAYCATALMSMSHVLVSDMMAAVQISQSDLV